MMSPGGTESVSWPGAQVGQACGKYHIIAQLGRGGMADVFLAVARGPGGFNKLLVLKQLPPARGADTELLTMFLDEASLAARLNHPNIVQVNEVGHDDDRYFIAMEYLEGQPLVRVLRRLQPDGLSIPMVLRVIAEACAALHYVHTLTDFDGTPLGVVHRDVSPHNLFITYAGQVKLVDFGIAKALHRSTETQIGMLKGKITYMSPEQIHGDPVDARSDVFALGIVLYEALTRERMWGPHPQEVDILRRLVNGEVPCSPREVAPDVPLDLDRICRRALATNREQRYASARELQEDLEDAIAKLPQRASERDVGDLVCRLFAEERTTIASVIEQQLKLIHAGDGAVVPASLPTLGVDGVISVTPSRLRAMRLPESSVPAPPPARKKRQTAALAVAALCLLVLLGVWASSSSTPAEEAANPARSATVSSLKPPSDATRQSVPGETVAVTPTDLAPNDVAPRRIVPNDVAPKAVAPNEVTPPPAAETPAPAAPMAANPVASAKKRMRKRADGATARTTAESAKPATTISAISTFGPLDGRK